MCVFPVYFTFFSVPFFNWEREWQKREHDTVILSLKAKLHGHKCTDLQPRWIISYPSWASITNLLANIYIFETRHFSLTKVLGKLKYDKWSTKNIRKYFDVQGGVMYPFSIFFLSWWSLELYFLRIIAKQHQIINFLMMNTIIILWKVSVWCLKVTLFFKSMQD